MVNKAHSLDYKLKMVQNKSTKSQEAARASNFGFFYALMNFMGYLAVYIAETVWDTVRSWALLVSVVAVSAFLLAEQTPNHRR
jgi:pheromone shutdown protein TraB